MKKAKALHPVPKPKPKPKAPHHPGHVAPPHSTGTASHLGIITPPAHHAKPGKPHHAVKPKKPKPKRKVRKLALGDAVACCSAEALAMSLRLAGWPVTDADVLELYRLTADGPDDGASIEATLDVAAKFGLAGAWPEFSLLGSLTCGDVASSFNSRRSADWPVSMLLGVDLPQGPHAMLATGAGWWSWGELYDPGQFRGATIEEAWAVTW